MEPRVLLVAAVAGVGVLHTIVPDHWVPITLVARQQGWSRRETARAAFRAGTGHVLSTLAIGLAVWIAGAAFAQRFGTLVSQLSSLALVAFGLWIAVASLREARSGGHGHAHADGSHEHNHDHDHDDDHDRDDERLYRPSRSPGTVVAVHAHLHRHGADAPPHRHLHDHDAATAHAIGDAESPEHAHEHKRSAQTALLLILGSSPMVEGIPAFFAASKYGFAQIALMACVFAVATIATYVALCTASAASLRRLHLGPFEAYGEAISGAFIALVGLIFLFVPAR